MNMTNIVKMFDNLIADESGQDLIEYALVAGLVGLVAITALQTLATKIIAIFTAISTALNAAA
jgi:pilus assembly protein Flp/PilA